VGPAPSSPPSTPGCRPNWARTRMLCVHAFTRLCPATDNDVFERQCQIVQRFLPSFYEMASIPHRYVHTQNGQVPIVDRRGWLHLSVFETRADPQESHQVLFYNSLLSSALSLFATSIGTRPSRSSHLSIPRRTSRSHRRYPDHLSPCTLTHN
jgi:hypothetical protein